MWLVLYTCVWLIPFFALVDEITKILRNHVCLLFTEYTFARQDGQDRNLKRNTSYSCNNITTTLIQISRLFLAFSPKLTMKR